jgi:hypothetical protein
MPKLESTSRSIKPPKPVVVAGARLHDAGAALGAFDADSGGGGGLGSFACGGRFDRLESLWRRRVKSAPTRFFATADLAQTPCRPRRGDRSGRGAYADAQLGR